LWRNEERGDLTGSIRLAVWGHPYIEFPEGRDDQDTINAAFSRMSDAGISIYFAFIATEKKILWASKIVPKPSIDMLSRLVKAGKASGVEVHPIIGFGSISPFFRLFPERTYKARSEVDLPQWAEGWVCPSWKENRDLTIKVGEELLEGYEVGGLHMDYMRYPNAGILAQNPCLCEACRKLRMDWLGKEALDENDLKSQGIVYKEIEARNLCVRETVEGLRRITRERGLKLSLAARANYVNDAVVEGQDWVSWCRDGLLDMVSPMSYTTKFDNFRRLLEEHVRLVGDSTSLFEGIGRSSSAGVLTPEEMMLQIGLAKERGLPGITIFHFNALTARDLELLKTI